MTSTPVVPRAVLAAIGAARAIEANFHTLFERREAASARLQKALKAWHRQEPGFSPRALNTAVYAKLRLEHGSAEYLRVAQMLSRAWRHGEETEVLKPMSLPRSLAEFLKLWEPRLERTGWAARVERKPHEVVIHLRPQEAEVAA